jgi:4-amino-4-deoxy-L-arabinose transferase-like glycosyltransferase
MNGSFSQKPVTETGFLVIEPRLAVVGMLRWARLRRAELLTGALLAVMGLQMLAVISRKSIIVDEIVMIPSAYYHLAAGDFQLVNEHPPFSKILAALPLLFVQPNEVRPDQANASSLSSEAKWAYQESFWANNVEHFESISFWSRVPMIALAVALGLLIFRFARKLFGARAAVLAVVLYTLEPTVLAHGRVVQTDIPAAFGYLLFFMALYHFAEKNTWRRAVLLGLAAGLAILAKYSMLLVGPVLALFFLAFLVRRWRMPEVRTRLLAHMALVMLAVLTAINAAYFFRHRQMGDADVQWIQSSFHAYGDTLTTTVRLLAHFLPVDFVLGVLFQFWHNGQGHSASLLGMYSERGWWYYFPVAFVLKSTIPFLLLSLVSVGWGVYQSIRNRDRRFIWLVVPVAVYAVFVLFSHINIGVRYLLPAYPWLFILGGALLDRLIKIRRAYRSGALIALSLLCWMAIETYRAFPDEMVYMNQLASRAPHWWYLSDSNVEWGDDARAVAAFLHERGEKRVGDAFLGGFFSLHYYGIERVDWLVPESRIDPPHYLAIGASYFNGSTIPAGPPGSGRETPQQRANFFEEYKHQKPEAVFGNSIYVFRVR